ncbi:MAG: hypothetical protein KGI57_09565 [Hyphomicrobiales bacterium]|nr:hypothetical protein [Hyphomicrobiales bacterium]MDE2017942.1 hypothetical protein [Hyphomicrobiales bacterium]
MNAKSASAGTQEEALRFRRAIGFTLLGLWSLWVGPAAAQSAATFSVSGDQALSYPASIQYLPDEHVTVLPAAGPAAARAVDAPRDFFVAMSNRVGAAHWGDAFVLRSSDFRHFDFAPGFGDARRGHAVFWPAHPAGGSCAHPGVTHFDEQYAAPGSVVQDPTLPPGNLIMVYEAEIHCPQSSKGMAAGWVSIGIARSADGGRSWPPPVAQKGYEGDWLEYGDGRYAGVTLPGAPPKKAFDAFYGDALPSAFVDDRDPTGQFYLYVAYQFTGAPGAEADARIHVARAWLGDRSGHRESGQLHFFKWRAGGWTQKGRGGSEDGASPPCGASYGEGGPQIAYDDALRRYVMTFVCTTYVCPSPGKCEATEDSLFFATATSLAKQDWSPARKIERSTYRRVNRPDGGWIVDGGYPSFVSPGCKPGHLGLTGSVFLLKGDPLGDRRFVSRSFAIKPAAPWVADPAASANGCERN